MTGVAVARESTGSLGSAMPATAAVRSPEGALGAPGTSTNAGAGRAEPATPSIPGTTATESAPLTKRYFRIGEVARIVGVEAHVLRYWEREFRQIRPEKSQRGQRVYSRADVGKLQSIRELLYTQGFTIAGAKKRLAAPSEEPVPTTESEPDAVAPSLKTSVNAGESVSVRPALLEVGPPSVATALPHPVALSEPASRRAETNVLPAILAEADDAVVSVRHAALLARPVKPPPRISEGARRELLTLRAELSALLTALES
jgi:DNA-binding transcriptional MerR regulator